MKALPIIFFMIQVCILNAQTDFSKFDNSKGTSMMPIFEKAKAIIKLIEEKKKEIVRMEYDIVTAGTKKSWRTLHKDVKYSLIAFGDYRVKDIDVSVFKYEDGKWVRVIKDKKEDSMAIVYVTPTKTQEYKIEISAYEFKNKYKAAHYGLFVTR